MTVSPTSALPVTLGQATQIQAPPENVAQFKALISGMNTSLSKGSSSFDNRDTQTEWAGSSLIEDTAIRVGLAEKAVQRLEREVRLKTQEMPDNHNLEGEMPRAIVEQKYATTYYFVGVNRVGDAGQNFAEELQSVTRGR